MHDSGWALTSFMHNFPFGITHKGFGHYAVPYVVMLALYLMHLHNCGPQIDTKIAWKSVPRWRCSAMSMVWNLL